MQSIQQSTMAAIKHYNNICYIREEVVRYVWLSGVVINVIDIILKMKNDKVGEG